MKEVSTQESMRRRWGTYTMAGALSSDATVRHPFKTQKRFRGVGGVSPELRYRKERAGWFFVAYRDPG